MEGLSERRKHLGASLSSAAFAEIDQLVPQKTSWKGNSNSSAYSFYSANGQAYCQANQVSYQAKARPNGE